MASKNMFEVLKRDESDDEEAPKRQTKHEQRADTKTQREIAGDQVQKQNYHSSNRDDRQSANNYNGEGKREFDRKSGSGANAHNKYEKKGGVGGKSNWGKDGQDYEVKEGDAKREEGANDQPEEVETPVMSLNDYMKESGMQMETKMDVGQSGHKTTTTQEKGMHVLQKKEVDWTKPTTNNNNVDTLHMSKTTNIEGSEPQGQGYNNRRGDNQGNIRGGKAHAKPKAKKLGNDDFPPLG